MKPGIYFDLPEQEYHDVPALSASGIKRLSESPYDFWWWSYLNPNRPEETQTPFLAMGNAYDCRITDGKEAFDRRYTVAPAPDDYPDALRSVDEIKAKLKEYGAPVTGKKADLIDRLLGLEPGAQVWDRIKEGDGREALSRDLYNRIEMTAAIIDLHPQLSKAFGGGRSQVSIFWNAEGVPMKARLDYLKARAIIDLKSFSNPMNKPVDRAVATTMASYKYHVQAAVYHEAVSHIGGFIQSGDVHGPVDMEWLRKVAAAKEREFVFVFVKTSGAPVVKGFVFPKGTTYDIGRITMRDAITKYRDMLDTYGTDPWIDPEPLRVFDDTDFPAWIGE